MAAVPGSEDPVMLAARYDCFLFDLDGVLYRGSDPVPHAAASIDRLRGSRRRLAFVTNNSAGTPAAVAERLRSVGVEVAEDEIETSALATADLLATRGVGSVYMIGEEGIRLALSDAGIAVLEGEPDSAEAVVVGLDRAVDYAKLRRASLLVEAGAPLIATNADTSFPAAGGAVWPGAGALVGAVEATTGARAEVVGKPNAPILRAALARAGGGRPLLIGDRLDTDIAGAAALGWDSLLVLTGIAGPDDVASADPAPTFVRADLTGLFDGSSA